MRLLGNRSSCGVRGTLGPHDSARNPRPKSARFEADLFLQEASEDAGTCKMMVKLALDRLKLLWRAVDACVERYAEYSDIKSYHPEGARVE